MITNRNEKQAEMIKAMRRRMYERARRYWQSVGDQKRLALTDEELDEQFWLFDPEGIPRLKSEEDTIEIPENPLLMIAKMADELGLSSGRGDISERSREILDTEFPDYLWRRMHGDYSDVESDTD